MEPGQAQVGWRDSLVSAYRSERGNEGGGDQRGHPPRLRELHDYQVRVRDDRIAIWNAAHLNPEWSAKLFAEEMR